MNEVLDLKADDFLKFGASSTRDNAAELFVSNPRTAIRWSRV